MRIQIRPPNQALALARQWITDEDRRLGSAGPGIDLGNPYPPAGTRLNPHRHRDRQESGQQHRPGGDRGPLSAGAALFSYRESVR
jgi:hypothetical protein